MIRPRTTTEIPQVSVLLETSTEYGRGLLRGIVRYSRLHGPWSLYIAPGHLEQVLPRSRSWNGTGVIARARSPELAKLIRSTGLPFVTSSPDESRPQGQKDQFGEIRTDSVAIGHMAAAHLLERMPDTINQDEIEQAKQLVSQLAVQGGSVQNIHRTPYFSLAAPTLMTPECCCHRQTWVKSLPVA